MKIFNRLLLFLIAIAVITSATIVIRYKLTADTENKKVAGGITSNTYQCQSATTTPEYMTTSTATSSCIVADLQNATNADLKIGLIASTTGSIIHRKLFVTNDDAGPTRNWFEIKDSAASWTPANAVASSSYLSVPLTNLAAKYLKVDYSVGGANAGVYLEVSRQNQLY